MGEKTTSETKYEHLLDEQIQMFINKTNSFFPTDSAALPINEQRRLYNEMCKAFKQLPDLPIIRTDYQLSEREVPVREYRVTASSDDQPVVIYYHGGGFVVGDLESHDDVCASICAFTHFNVISCDYKLAPEFKHPHAFNDAYAVFESVTSNTSQAVLVVGDSAGATLAACVSAKARFREKNVAAQILIYPYLGGPTDIGSYADHAHAPMLSTNDMKYYQNIRIDPCQPLPDDDTFAPLWSTDFSKLPPTAIFTAQCDPLCDDGTSYAEHINRAGGNAQCTVEKGLVHGYLRARHTSVKANDSFTRILLAIQTLARKP